MFYQNFISALLLTSYLTERKQYVEVDTFKSPVLKSPSCSVIQGGKLSGLLYTVYTNEITCLHNFLFTEMFQKITGYKSNSLCNGHHCTINFVDDSSSIISFKDSNNVKNYLTDYYNLLDSYYNINFLQINPDKSKLLLILKPKLKNQFENFYFNAKQHKIKPLKKLKILGFYISNDLKMTSQVGKLCSELHHKMFELNKLTKFMTFETRLMFIKSFIIGKLIYALPIYLGMEKELYKKIHKIIMRSARISIGNYCFKKSIDYILNKCDILDSEDSIMFSSVKFLYGLRTKKEPKAIVNLFKKQNQRTKNIELYPHKMAKSTKLKNSCLHRGAEVFNQLPNEIKTGRLQKFSENLKNYIKTNKSWDKQAEL